MTRDKGPHGFCTRLEPNAPQGHLQSTNNASQIFFGAVYGNIEIFLRAPQSL